MRAAAAVAVCCMPAALSATAPAAHHAAVVRHPGGSASEHHVVFDATLPWTTASVSHNAFSPTYPTEAAARNHSLWFLSANCTLRYNGTLAQPPQMALMANGLEGLDPATAQTIPVRLGAVPLRRVQLTHLDIVCADATNRRQCFWFGQFTLVVLPGTGVPEGGADSVLDCADLSACEVSDAASCFPCVQSGSGGCQ
eukprot:TRINITY_DN9131_c0_g1_i1.p2 TRINITY_DN9131_c0_g1~~TRINITY_DN9131_c0_g1_i1.p2  ORF type:complete len:197 (+),score=42.80 TRINITY_DN9131_c0_g1_i1:83-673(+)